jgi:hypothetical protein
MFPGGMKRTSPSTKSPIKKGPHMFEKNVPSREQMLKDWQKKEREMTTRKPGPNDLKPLKKGGKFKKAQVGVKQSSDSTKTLPSVTVTSQAASKKKPLMQRMFGTPEERQERKENRQANREERQYNRQSRREDRRYSRGCRRDGRCGGRGMGYIGYDKNGGKTKKAKTGTKVSKSSKKK